MKLAKNVKWLIYLCGTFLILIYLYALYSEQPLEDYEKRFTFVSTLRWDNAATGMREADQKFRTNTKLVAPETLNIETQIEAIHEAILSKADGIITAASEDSEGLKEVIQKAVSEGIPVILIDSDLPDSGRSSYIGTDNVEAGRIAGRDIYNATDGYAKIGIIVSSLESPNQRERVKGFMEEINQYENMEVLEIVECHSNGLEIVENVPKLLKDYPEMNALFLTEASASYMVGDLLQSYDISSEELKVVGFDNVEKTLEFVRDGIYYSTIVQEQYMFGYRAVETLCRILNGETVEDVIYTDVYSLRKENYEDRKTYPYEEWEWHIY